MFKVIGTLSRLVKLLGVHILITIGLMVSTDMIFELNDFESRVEKRFDESPLIAILFAVVIAPIWEEMVFRYPLKRDTQLWWPLILGIIFLLSFELVTLQILMAIFLVSLYLFKIRNSPFVTRFTIGISILVFGLMHIGNYSVEDIEQMRVIELISTFLSQIVAGGVLTFVRLKYSFEYGVIYHSAFNAIFVSIALIAESI